MAKGDIFCGCPCRKNISCLQPGFIGDAANQMKGNLILYPIGFTNKSQGKTVPEFEENKAEGQIWHFQNGLCNTSENTHIELVHHFQQWQEKEKLDYQPLEGAMVLLEEHIPTGGR